MGRWICMGCLNVKDQDLCPHCGRRNDQLWNISAQLNVFTPLKNGQYTVGVAKGGMVGEPHGYTYTGWDHANQRPVTIKECAYIRECGERKDAIASSDPHWYSFVHSFEVLWRTQRRLNLRSIPRIWDIFPSDVSSESYTVYAVQERVEGIPLDRFLQNLGGKLNGAGVVRLLGPVMGDLCRAHSVGLFHGDIGIHALAVTGDGTARFFDFGTGENFGDADIPVPPSRTPYTYLDQKEYSELERNQREEVYQMGLLLWECLTGNRRENFRRGMPRQLDWTGCDPVFTQTMRGAVERAASADVHYQYMTMADFRRDLFRELSGTGRY